MTHDSIMRQYHFLEDPKALLHYSVYGEGKKAMLCFHGFGQTSVYFHELEEVMKDEYTIYNFDLFYHGQSFWHAKDTPISKEYWAGLIGKFLKEKNIDRFSLTGFSMGGKFALATLEAFPERIDKIILIAPDGIKTSFWYSLATYPEWTRSFFRRLILKPGLYFNLTKFLRFFRIVDAGILRFANTQMLTREQRRRVYYSWVVFRELKFDMDKLAGLFIHHQIKPDIFLGTLDRIITEKNMDVLLKKLNHYEIHLLESGHSNLIKAVAGFMKSRK
ncbi:MAG: alpha/beta hydrolase [Cytophagaceae bacterium]